MKTQQDRKDEIINALLEEFAAHKFEDTPENRLSGLKGLRDAWREDPDNSNEKKKNYQIALSSLILDLEIRLNLWK
jgi:hypothetical protein